MFRPVPKSAARCRSGVTLAELLIAIGIMALLAAALTTLATTVEMASEQSRGVGLATQHARVALERIERTLRSAYATADYPGFMVVPTVVGTTSFPDALVVWTPVGGAPANAAGPPLMRELTVYALDATNPNELLELRDASDARAAPAWSDMNAWRGELAALPGRSGVKRVRLTDLVRTGVVSTSGGVNGQPVYRGAARFETLHRPSATEWSEFQTGSRTWDNLSWVQDIYGKNAGLRQSWCQIELQLMPSRSAAASDTSGQSASPFFGSAAVYYELTR